jgi:cytochrome b561
MPYSFFVRVLHWCLALGISLQLMLSLVMARPESGVTRSPFQALTFEAHEALGITLLLVLVAQWLCMFLGRRDEGAAHFFPWFSRIRMRQIYLESGKLVPGRLDDPATQHHLAGAVQGLGMLIATALATSGMVVWLGMDEQGKLPAAARTALDLHQTIAPAMWAYLTIHVGAALAHGVRGHRAIWSIFRRRG